MIHAHPTRSSRSLLAVLLITCGIAMGTVSMGLLLHSKRTEPKPPPGASTSRPVPSSTKPSAKTVASYSVPPTNPKYIAIPAIAISNTPIQKLGLLKNGAIATPDNIFETGWYDGSSLPGQPGAMFIYGHVSSWTANGVFYNLKNLRPGQTITITRGDDKTYLYKVVSSKVYQYDKVDMGQVLSPIDSARPGLNLMTCTGQVIKGTSEFNERLVIFTSLVT